jgi:hypothetical protein
MKMIFIILNETANVGRYQCAEGLIFLGRGRYRPRSCLRVGQHPPLADDRRIDVARPAMLAHRLLDPAQDLVLRSIEVHGFQIRLAPASGTPLVEREQASHSVGQDLGGTAGVPISTGWRLP